MLGISVCLFLFEGPSTSKMEINNKQPKSSKQLQANSGNHVFTLLTFEWLMNGRMDWVGAWKSRSKSASDPQRKGCGRRGGPVVGGQHAEGV